MRVLPYGDRDLLVEVADVVEAAALAAVVRADVRAADLLADLVPGARTVLLRASAGVRQQQLHDLVPDAALLRTERARQREPGPEVVVPVVYDGEDLAEVARLTGLSPVEVVTAHASAPWLAAFCGFAPGFAYLVGGDPRLQVPRREAPRPRVPAGAVALAGAFSGVYPRPSPGGWQILGRTDVALWDLGREVPALITPGVRVRFEDVG